MLGLDMELEVEASCVLKNKAQALLRVKGWACNQENYELSYELRMDLQLGQLQTMRPVASEGSTCNWDKTNYGPSCEFKDGLATRMKDKNTGPVASQGWACNWDKKT